MARAKSNPRTRNTRNEIGGESGPLTDWIPTFIASRRDRDTGDLTVDRYERTLRQWIEWLHENDRPEDVQALSGKRGAEHLRDYLRHLQDTGIAPGTRRTFYQVVKTFYRWAVMESLDEDDDPTLPPYVKRSPTDYVDSPSSETLPGVGEDFSDAEYHRMLEAAGDPRTNNVWKRRNRALLILLRYTGLRRVELHGLLVSDYNTATGHLTIRNSVAKRTKGGQDARTVAVSNSAKVEVDKYVRLLGDHGLKAGPFIPSERKVKGVTVAVTTNGINAIIRSLALGLREGCPNRAQHAGGMGCEDACIRWTDVHRWRHTWAIQSLMSGVPALSLMYAGGWSNMAMVDRYVKTAGQRLSLRDFERVSR